MHKVYVLQPSRARGSLQDVIQRATGLEGVEGIPPNVAAARITHVEVCCGRREWRLFLDEPELTPDQCQDAATILLARLTHHVDRIVILPQEGKPTAAPEPSSQTAAHRQPRVTAASEVAAGDNGADTEEQQAISGPAPAVDGQASDHRSDEESDEAYMNLILEMARQEPIQVTERSNGSGGGKTSGKTGSDTILGNAIRQDATPLADIVDEERSVVVQGTVFSVEARELRSGRTLVTFDFTDGTDSLTGKVFLDEEQSHLASQLKAGTVIKGRGPVQYDKFTQELVLMPRDLMRLPPGEELMDDHPEPRVELHLHTKMSALDGITEAEEAIALAAKWKHPAIAITDHGVVQAFPRAYNAGKKHGIKVLLGVEGYLVNSTDNQARMYHIVLFAQTQKGLKNLYKLVSLAHMKYFYRRPRTPREELIAHREGLLIGSACEAGEVYQAVLNDVPDDELDEIASFYDYLEIQPVANTSFLVDQGRVPDMAALQRLNARIVACGRRLGKPVVATGDVHFLKPEHEVFRQIVMAGHGFTDVERPLPLYLRTTQEMLEEFAYLGEEEAYRVVVEAPRAVAASIEDLRPIPDGFHPPYLDGAEDEVRHMTLDRAYALYGKPLPELIEKRVQRELDSIIGNGYASLYLIAHKLVKKSLDDGYLVGSRGSVGSSLVANFMDISEVNPLPPHYICGTCHYLEVFDDGTVGAGPDLPPKSCPQCGTPLRRDGFDIPFETFLGFEGDKVPDIDLNFSGEYQPRAHKYAEELLGAENLYRAGTIGTLGERTAYGYVRKFLESHNRQARGAEVNRLVKGITGIRRTSGQHPGGLMVVPEGRDIFEFTPIQFPANDRDSNTVTTHFDFNTIHDQLVKLDMLGHEGPTAVRMLEDLTDIKVASIPLDDEATMGIFSGLEPLGISEEDAGGKVGTLGIPEYGTSFVRQMLEDTRPRTFADLVRIMGLSHGTDVWLNNAQDLVRNGTVTLSETIAARDDIMIYLMRQGLPPRTAFKIMEQVRRGRGLEPEDEQIMKSHNVPGWYIEACQKISYMFPKAHAVAYAVMAFYIAYFKVHWPTQFYATYLTSKVDDCDANLLLQSPQQLRQVLADINKKGNDASAKEKNVATVIEVVIEAMARGITFTPIDIYESKARHFVPIGETELLLPISAMPGIGTAAGESVVKAREEGVFTSIEDLRRRTGLTKTATQALTEHGSLTGWSESDQLSLF